MIQSKNNHKQLESPDILRQLVQTYLESLKNLKPMDVYEERGQQILGRREMIKRKNASDDP